MCIVNNDRLCVGAIQTHCYMHGACLQADMLWLKIKYLQQVKQAPLSSLGLHHHTASQLAIDRADIHTHIHECLQIVIAVHVPDSEQVKHDWTIICVGRIRQPTGGNGPVGGCINKMWSRQKQLYHTPTLLYTARHTHPHTPAHTPNGATAVS